MSGPVSAERERALAWDLGYFEAVGGPDAGSTLADQLDIGNPYRFTDDEGQWLAMRARAYVEATK